MASILCMDDEPGLREYLADALSHGGHEVVTAEDAAEALGRLEDRPFDVAVLDLRMPGALGGMDVLRRARAEWPDMQVVVLTAHGTVGEAVEAMRIGAFDFIEKPIESPDALRRLVTRALNWRGTASSGAPDEVIENRWGWPRASAAGDAVVKRSDDRRVSRGPLAAAGKFLWQLKRRLVYNVAATYAAVGFVGLQASELIVPVLPLPSWVFTALVGLVIAGFPVALVAAWVYDVTSSGVVRGTAGGS
jgi:CheY-like chemotaxis protein